MYEHSTLTVYYYYYVMYLLICQLILPKEYIVNKYFVDYYQNPHKHYQTSMLVLHTTSNFT